MTYLTQQNDRKHRRRARTLTFLITASLGLAFAYASGLLGEVPLLYEYFTGPPAPVA